MTPKEADAAFDAAPSIPISKDEAGAMLRYVGDRERERRIANTWLNRCTHGQKNFACQTCMEAAMREAVVAATSGQERCDENAKLKAENAELRNVCMGQIDAAFGEVKAMLSSEAMTPKKRAAETYAKILQSNGAVMPEDYIELAIVTAVREETSAMLAMASLLPMRS